VTSLNIISHNPRMNTCLPFPDHAPSSHTSILIGPEVMNMQMSNAQPLPLHLIGSIYLFFCTEVLEFLEQLSAGRWSPAGPSNKDYSDLTL